MSFVKDRYFLRFCLSLPLFLLCLWIAQAQEGMLRAAAIPGLAAGLIAAMYGLFWIGADNITNRPDGIVESKFPAGHVLASGALAISGAFIAAFCLFGHFTGDLANIRIVGAGIGLAAFAFWTVAAVHCVSYRVRLKQGTIHATGGLRANLRKGPLVLAELSKRKGVELADGSPRKYRLTFKGKRTFDLHSHMTGTQSILLAAAQFYPHDYAWDDCLIRTKDA